MGYYVCMVWRSYSNLHFRKVEPSSCIFMKPKLHLNVFWNTVRWRRVRLKSVPITCSASLLERRLLNLPLNVTSGLYDQLSLYSSQFHSIFFLLPGVTVSIYQSERTCFRPQSLLAPLGQEQYIFFVALPSFSLNVWHIGVIISVVLHGQNTLEPLMVLTRQV